ncbi:MAG: peptidylprolyl isomerase, partial [Hyphomicrobiales bacterium]
ALPDLQAEFSGGRFSRGTVGMARGQSPNSANSQFFIMTGEARWLEGEHTIFGRVVNGIELIDRLRDGTKAANGLVKKPDSIVAIRLAADIERRKERKAKTAVAAQKAADLAELKTQEAAAASARADGALQVAERALDSLLSATDKSVVNSLIASDAKAAVNLAMEEKQTADRNVVETGDRLTKAEKALVDAIASATRLAVSAERTLEQRDFAIAVSKTSDEAVVEAEATLVSSQENLVELQAAAELAAAKRDEAEQVEFAAKQAKSVIDVDGGKALSRKALGELAITVAGLKKAQSKADLENDAAAIADEIRSFSEMSFDDATEKVAAAETSVETASVVLDEARVAATEAEAAKAIAEEELTLAINTRVSAENVLDGQKALELKEAEAALVAAKQAAEAKAAADAAAAALAETSGIDPGFFEPQNETPAIIPEADAVADNEEIIEEVAEPSDVVVALTKQLEVAIEAEGAARLELASREVAAENAFEAVQIAGDELESAKERLALAETALTLSAEALASAAQDLESAQNVLSEALAELEVATGIRDAAKAVGDEADADRAQLNAKFAAASAALELAISENVMATAEAEAAAEAVMAAIERVEQSQDTLDNTIAMAAEQKRNLEDAIERKATADDALELAESTVKAAEELVGDLRSELSDKEKVAEAAAINLLEKEVTLEESNSENENAITLMQLAEVAEQGAQTNLNRARAELSAANDERDKAAAAALKRFSEASAAAAASASDIPLFER